MDQFLVSVTRGQPARGTIRCGGVMSDSGPAHPLVPGTPVTRRSVLTGIAGVGGAAALAGCGSSSKSGAATPTTGGATSAAAAPTSSAAAATSAARPPAAHHLRLELLRPGRQDGVRALRGGGGQRPVSRSPLTRSTTTRSRTTSAAYLQGTPDDLATWFAGYRMQFFAAQGLLDRPSTTSGTRSAATSTTPPRRCRRAWTGKYYFVPLYNYPWVVFYNKSTFAAEGLHHPDDVGRLHRAGQEDEDGRAHPACLRRQGRLAGAGHVRHHQPAAERLRLPHQADEAPGPVDRQGRDGGLRPVGRDPAATARAARTAASGRTRPRRWRASRPA